MFKKEFVCLQETAVFTRYCSVFRQIGIREKGFFAQIPTKSCKKLLRQLNLSRLRKLMLINLYELSENLAV